VLASDLALGQNVRYVCNRYGCRWQPILPPLRLSVVLRLRPKYYGYGLSYYGYRRSYYGYGKFPALPLKPFAPEPLQVHSPKACASLPTVGQFGPSAHGGCEKWT
jgi:hypothetical protein